MMPRTETPESDRPTKRVKVSLATAEYQKLTAMADSDFAPVSAVARDLLVIGMQSREVGELPALTGLAAMRERKLKLDIQIKEREDARQRGELLEVDEVVKFYARKLTTFKKALDDLPNVAPDFTLEQRDKIKAALAAAYHMIRTADYSEPAEQPSQP